MSWLIYVVKISSKKCLAYWQQIHFRTSVLPRKSLIQVFLNFLQERERDCEFVAKIFFSHLDRNAWWMIWDVPRQCCCNQCSREQCGRPPVTPRCHWFPEPRQHESVPPGPVGYQWQHLWRLWISQSDSNVWVFPVWCQGLNAMDPIKATVWKHKGTNT